MPPEQVIMFIIGTVVVLFGAYYVTYYVGMKASGQTRAGFKNRNIKLIDRYAIARDKQFCIIEIAGKVYIVGATNHAMMLLDTIDAEEFERLAEKYADNNTMPWNMTPVGQYGNMLTRKVVEFIAKKTGKIPQDEETGPTGPKNNVEYNKSGFAESLKEAELAADYKNEKNNEHDEDHDLNTEEEAPEEVSPDNPHESMKAWRKPDAD